MKQLMITSYDSEWKFSWVVIENSKLIEKGDNSKDLRKYGLYDEEWCWFSENLIENNKLLKDFDQIIVCEDAYYNIYFPKEGLPFIEGVDDDEEDF